MTLNEYESKNTNRKDSSRHTENLKIAQVLQKIYNSKCIDFHNNDSSSELWQRITADWEGENFSDWITDIVECISDYYFYKNGRLPYTLENKLFRLMLIGKDYQNNNNEAVREFLSIDFSTFMKFMRENVYEDYYNIFSMQLLDDNNPVSAGYTLGDVLNNAYKMWHRSTYHNMVSKEATTLIMLYPFMITFQSSRCKKEFHRLLRTM